MCDGAFLTGRIALHLHKIDHTGAEPGGNDNGRRVA